MSWQIDRSNKVFDSEEEAIEYCKCMQQYGIVCSMRQVPYNPTYKWILGRDFGLVKIERAE